MRIGIDLDNVLNNLSEEWVNTYNEYHSDSLTIEDIKSWDMHEHVKCGKEIYKYLDGNLFSSLKPQPYSIEVTKELQKDHELYVVTASYPKNLDVKMNWLDKYFPHIGYKNVIICQRKDLINVDVLIDDAPFNVAQFPNRVIVKDYAWNRYLQNSYCRVSDWREIAKYINMWAKLK